MRSEKVVTSVVQFCRLPINHFKTHYVNVIAIHETDHVARDSNKNSLNQRASVHAAVRPISGLFFYSAAVVHVFSSSSLALR